MSLPVTKLGTLVLKTVAKPIANRLKKEAALHPQFRQIIVNIAQTNHRFTTNMQRRIYGHATDVAIRPLNEEKAIQAATDLIGEVFVFTIGIELFIPFAYPHSATFKFCQAFKVAGAAVIFEVQRSARSEARKEEKRRLEFEAMKQRDEEIAREIEVLKNKAAELEQLAKGRGLGGVFKFKQADSIKDGQAKPA